MAYTADCLRARTMKAREDKRLGHDQAPENEKYVNEEDVQRKGPEKVKFNDVNTLGFLEFYNKLLPIEGGAAIKPEDQHTVN